MGEVKLSAIEVTFGAKSLGDKVMFSVMDELVRRLIFDFKKTRTAEEVESALRFGWVGSGDDPYKFQVQISGPHDSNEVRDTVVTLEDDAKARQMPVHYFYERA